MSFTTNVQITKNTPGVIYDATETSGTWHEDHEINGARYLAANAKFVEGTSKWTLINPSQAAYATVQNTDGSTGYLYMPASSPDWFTSAWQGAGQPATYYAVNYGMTSSDTTGAINTPALAAAIAAAIADPGNAGATVHIPAGTYVLNATITISGQSGKGIVIMGASGGTTLSQKANVDIFDISSWTGGTGLRFKDLYLQYGVDFGATGNTAVNVNTSGNHGENITCERVYFDNCPTSFSAGPNSLQCGLLNCTIDYHNTALNGQTAVSLNGSENFVRGCVIRQPGHDSPSGCFGVYVTGAMTCYVVDTHISHFETGIHIVGGPTAEAYFTNVHVDAFTTAVEIAPTDRTGQIYEVHFSNCTFSLSNDSTTTGSSGVTIGTASGPSSNVAGIFFDNCSVLGFGGAGIEIDGGQNIVVTGGQYSSNGQSPGSAPYIGAGIAITSGTEITIVGADCSGVSYYWKNVLLSTGTTQPYGITVNNSASEVTVVGCNVTGNATNGIVVANSAGTPTDVFIRDCDASGYSAFNTAINATSSFSSLQVTNCAGYNDRNATVNATAPSGMGQSASNQGSNGGSNYFGPSQVTYVGPSDIKVHISGTTFPMTSGSVYLARPVDEIYFSSDTPAPFTWLGK